MGASVTVSASVTGPGGVTAPTGNVQFQVSVNGGSYANFGSPAALSGSSASISYNPSTATTYNFKAVYQGDSNYVSGTTGSASVTLTVNKGSATVPAPTLNPVSPITLGGSVTASVTVTGSVGTPTGSITFQYSTDGGTTWNSLGVVKTLSGGSATSDSYIPTASGSNYQFRAVYNGDSNYSGLTSSAASLTVNQATATVGAATFSPGSPITLGASVTVSATCYWSWRSYGSCW